MTFIKLIRATFCWAGSTTVYIIICTVGETSVLSHHM